MAKLAHLFWNVVVFERTEFSEISMVLQKFYYPKPPTREGLRDKEGLIGRCSTLNFKI